MLYKSSKSSTPTAPNDFFATMSNPITIEQVIESERGIILEMIAAEPDMGIFGRPDGTWTLMGSIETDL